MTILRSSSHCSGTNVRKSELAGVVKPDAMEENELSDYGACVLHSTLALNTNPPTPMPLELWSLENTFCRSSSLNEMSFLVSGI